MCGIGWAMDLGTSREMPFDGRDILGSDAYTSLFRDP
jgi:hypothetical protein